MNRDEILKAILTFISNVFIWVIIVAIVLFMYFFFNKDLYEKLMKFLVPVFIYSLGIVVMAFWRKRKNDNLVKGGSETGQTIYVTQWDKMKHDVVMFATPLIMLLVTKLYKKNVEGFDIILSAIAFLGLYMSEWVYKKK